MDSQVLLALALSLVGGLSTSIGALFVIVNNAPNLKLLGLLQGFAAGLMLSISFLDLAHNALNSIGFLKGNLWFFAGVLFFAFVVNFIPEPTIVPTTDTKDKQKDDDGSGKDLMRKHRRQVLFSGIITAVGISLHNFPEGMAVFLGSIKGLHIGLNLAVAIALHNIPEGVAVALPIYFATGSKWQAFRLATLSGLAEPLGVIIVAYLFPRSLNPEILEGLLGAVGGVMAFLTLHEMLPLAFDYAGQKQAVKAVFLGMAFMSARIVLIMGYLWYFREPFQILPCDLNFAQLVFLRDQPAEGDELVDIGWLKTYHNLRHFVHSMIWRGSSNPAAKLSILYHSFFISSMAVTSVTISLLPK